MLFLLLRVICFLVLLFGFNTCRWWEHCSQEFNTAGNPTVESKKWLETSPLNTLTFSIAVLKRAISVAHITYMFTLPTGGALLPTIKMNWNHPLKLAGAIIVSRNALSHLPSVGNPCHKTMYNRPVLFFFDRISAYTIILDQKGSGSTFGLCLWDSGSNRVYWAEVPEWNYSQCFPPPLKGWRSPAALLFQNSQKRHRFSKMSGQRRRIRCCMLRKRCNCS